MFIALELQHPNNQFGEKNSHESINIIRKYREKKNQIPFSIDTNKTDLLITQPINKAKTNNLD